MPTYQYRCDECGRVFETVEHIDEHGRSRPECPDCTGRNVEQVLTPFFAKTDKKS